MTDFVQVGRAAYKSGGLRAPMHNPVVAAAITERGAPVGDPETTRIMTDFTKGFDEESDKAWVALLGPDSAWYYPTA